MEILTMSEDELRSVERLRKEKLSNWERHGQSILAALILSGIVAMVTIQYKTSDLIKDLQGVVNLLNFKLEVMQRQLDSDTNRFVSKSELTTFTYRLTQVENRTTSLEINQTIFMTEQQLRGPRINRLENKHKRNK